MFVAQEFVENPDFHKYFSTSILSLISHYFEQSRWPHFNFNIC